MNLICIPLIIVIILTTLRADLLTKNEFLLLGFFTGISLILAIGAQNIFVNRAGTKKKIRIYCLFNLFFIRFYFNFFRYFFI